MSFALALPATTTVLKALIEARLRLAYGNLFAPPVLLAPPPPRPAPMPGSTPPAEPAALHLVLHHVAPNPALRNQYDPGIDGAGIRVARVPLVLDLHYLLAASGADLEREVLLGIGMHALHRAAIVPRALIQSLLGATAVPPQPPNLSSTVPTEPLHDAASQPQQLTISILPSDLDAMSKLWSALQSPLRPSVQYLVTAIYLDADDAVAPPDPAEILRLRLRPSPDIDADPAGDTMVELRDP